MTKDQLIEQVTRDEAYSEDEMEEIRSELVALETAEAYKVLMEINEKGKNAQKDLMVFLSEDATLYEAMTEHVKSLNPEPEQAEGEEAEEAEAAVEETEDE